MARIGATVPTACHSVPIDAPAFAEQGQACGYDTIWVRDWPLGICAHDGRVDHASGWDPIAMIASIAPKHAHLGFGTAVLRTDYRLSAVTARSIVSLSMVTNGELQIGLGSGPLRDEAERARFIGSVADIYDLLSGLATEPFIRPLDYQPPSLLMATQRPDVWSAVSGRPLGLITSVMNPRSLRAAIKDARDSGNVQSVVLQCSIDFDPTDPKKLENRKPFLLIGEQRLIALAQEWIAAGVHELVLHLPPHTKFNCRSEIPELLREGIETL